MKSRGAFMKNTLKYFFGVFLLFSACAWSRASDILIVVVRYYGGVNLGTSGLIIAYREAAADAIAHATIETRQVEERIVFKFPYEMMNDVMRVVKDMQPRIISQTYDNTCEITLSIRQSEALQLRSRLEKLRP